MKTTLRITFYNYSIDESVRERVNDLLKNAYWTVGQEPEDWKDFDGEIEVESQQSRGGDCALVLVSFSWQKDIYKSLIRHKEVRSVEVLYTENTKDFIKETFSYKNQPQEYMLNEFVSN